MSGLINEQVDERWTLVCKSAGDPALYRRDDGATVRVIPPLRMGDFAMAIFVDAEGEVRTPTGGHFSTAHCAMEWADAAYPIED